MTGQLAWLSAATLHDYIICCIVRWFAVPSRCSFIAYGNVDFVEFHFVLELFSACPLLLRGPSSGSTCGSPSSSSVRLHFFLKFVYLLIRRIHEGPWSLPGPRRDGNGGSALVASPSWRAIRQMLSLSFPYSVCQPPGTTCCCRVPFKSRSKASCSGVPDRPHQSPRMQSLVSFKATTTVSQR